MKSPLYGCKSPSTAKLGHDGRGDVVRVSLWGVFVAIARFAWRIESTRYRLSQRLFETQVPIVVWAVDCWQAR